MIWSRKPSLDQLNALSVNSCAENVGIEFVDAGEDYLLAKMPVDKRTTQPFGILHGGASCVLAETIGSVASMCVVEDPNTQKAVGMSINANHVTPATKGFVNARCTPLNLGKKVHIWNIEIENEEGKLVCISRLTVMIVS